MKTVTGKQLSVLIELARYKFLSTKQLLQLIPGNQEHLYTKLVQMRVEDKTPEQKRSTKRGLVRCHKFQVNPGVGKHPDVYFLTEWGKNFLVEENILNESEIRYPKGRNTKVPSTVIHRTSTVDIHIAMQKWLESVEGEMLYVSADFDQAGSHRLGNVTFPNKIAINEHLYIIPDLITHIEANQNNYIFAWEQHNGKNTKKLIGQVKNHIEALKQKAVGEKLGINKLHRVGIVFEFESIKKAAMQRLYDEYGDSSSLHKCFLFKTNQEVKDDFYNHWDLWNGTQTVLLK